MHLHRRARACDPDGDPRSEAPKQARGHRIQLPRSEIVSGTYSSYWCYSSSEARKESTCFTILPKILLYSRTDYRLHTVHARD